MNKLLNVLLVAAFGLSAVFIAACAFGQTSANGNQIVSDSPAVIAEDNATNMPGEEESEAESLAKTIKVTVSGRFN